MEIVSFADGFAEEAASLLARAHADGVPRTDLADAAIARAHVAALGTTGPAVAAVDGDGRLAGFMAATVTGFPHDSKARVRMQHHAAVPGRVRTTYRHLYRGLSRQLTDIGCFDHAVTVAVAHGGAAALPRRGPGAQTRVARRRRDR